jgi:hypothetical protein
MQTRSQTRMLMESSMASVKKATRSNKNTTCCTASSKSTKVMDTPVVATTPVKSTKNIKDTPVAPNAPIQTRYRTRSSTNTNTRNSITTAKKNLVQDFDTAFFDESSAAWNENKKKLGNGMYAYRTRSTTRK